MDCDEYAPSKGVLRREHLSVRENSQVRVIKEDEGPEGVNARRCGFLEQDEEDGGHKQEVANDNEEECEAAYEHLYQGHDQSRDGADYKEKGEETEPGD